MGRQMIKLDEERLCSECRCESRGLDQSGLESEDTLCMQRRRDGALELTAVINGR